MFRGTPPYLSPEQAKAERPVSASDVFSFGLVLYELLTAKRALPVRSLKTAARMVRNRDLRPLARELPVPYRALVSLCLSPSPEERPTMAALAGWLEERGRRPAP